MNTFRINDYKDNFIRAITTKEESIYLFVELCRINPYFQIGLIVRSYEILVAQDVFEEFLEFTRDIGIFFTTEDGVTGNENLVFGKDLYSRGCHKQNFSIKKE